MPISPTSVIAFRDEMEKIAFDPVTSAGMMAAGKIGLTNAIGRHALSIAPVRRLGQEIAGVGLRTAAQGKPMVSRPLREALAIGVDPKAVGLYENAHAVGSRVGQGGLANPRATLDTMQQLAAHEGVRPSPEVLKARKFVEGIPTESTGIRKAIDYTFTPVSQVGRDIRDLARRAVGRGPASPPVHPPAPTAPQKIQQMGRPQPTPPAAQQAAPMPQPAPQAAPAPQPTQQPAPKINPRQGSGILPYAAGGAALAASGVGVQQMIQRKKQAVSP